ncbi:uncharacterized protein SCODWIG_03661 [Saccharomycodes ludwigii]|uniref:Peptidase A1 domain-containing protein n=1 Tax=Saccharomycodes ludwigii TaxID=36035 RepID=A0A376BCQ0_9ASCO|nr:uncharacterized protein SCODWIG_03661 [Saccharomycodes ludwigii]
MIFLREAKDKITKGDKTAEKALDDIFKRDLFKALGDAIDEGFDKAKDKITKGDKAAEEALDDIFKRSFFSDLGDDIKGGIDEGFDKAKDKITKGDKTAEKALDDIFKREDIIDLIENGLGIHTDKRSVTNSVEGVEKDALSDFWSEFSTFLASQTLGQASTTVGSVSSTSSSSDYTYCKLYGTFNPNNSDTFKSNDTDFYIVYGDDSFALGNWGTDVVGINGVSLDGLTFAVANTTNSTVGVLGIGLQGLEVTYTGYTAQSVGKSYTYNNLPALLKSSGDIDVTAYSLFLNNDTASTGSILFGAVDHSKYSGQLYTVPIVNIYSSKNINSAIEFDITLQGIGFSNGKKNSTYSTTKVPALLDSGTTMVYFPEALAEIVADGLGATYSSELGVYLLDCNSVEDSDNLVFDFGGFLINSPLNNFIFSTNSDTLCAFGIIPSDDDYIILGDSFLQTAYVVYDLDNLEISLAEADYSNSEENIDVIKSSVPSAIKAPNYSNSWSSFASGYNTGGNIFTVTTQAASSSAGSSSVNATSSGSSVNASGSVTASGTVSASSSITTATSSTTTSSSKTGNGSNKSVAGWGTIWTLIALLLAAFI